MSRDTRMRNDDLALCQWAHDVWGSISRKPLEIETWVQWTINRKWTIASPMVTWPMTWPWKVKVVTPICLGPSISETAGDKDLW